MLIGWWAAINIYMEEGVMIIEFTNLTLVRVVSQLLMTQPLVIFGEYLYQEMDSFWQLEELEATCISLIHQL